jgi:hypothetical protein
VRSKRKIEKSIRRHITEDSFIYSPVEVCGNLLFSLHIYYFGYCISSYVYLNCTFRKLNYLVIRCRKGKGPNWIGPLLHLHLMTEYDPALETSDVSKRIDNVQQNNFVTKVLLTKCIFFPKCKHIF